MQQLHLIAIPNGTFTLEEALQDSTIQQAAKNIQSLEGPTTSKIKALLTVYQMIDALHQMREQGIDTHQLNFEVFRDSMKATINLGYDSIMNNFNKKQKKILQELIEKAQEH